MVGASTRLEARGLGGFFERTVKKLKDFWADSVDFHVRFSISIIDFRFPISDIRFSIFSPPRPLASRRVDALNSTKPSKPPRTSKPISWGEGLPSPYPLPTPPTRLLRRWVGGSRRLFLPYKTNTFSTFSLSSLSQLPKPTQSHPHLPKLTPK